MPIHFTSLPVTSPLVCFASGGSWMSKSPASLGEFGGSVHALVSLLPLPGHCRCHASACQTADPRLCPGLVCKEPCLYSCVSVPFPGSLFLAICLTWQALTKTRSTLPRKPTVAPLLQGACYSPFLNGSNFWTSGIMIHEAV